MQPPASIVHIVSADLAPLTLRRLHCVIHADGIIGKQGIIQVAGGRRLSISGYRSRQLHVPVEWSSLVAHALRRALAHVPRPAVLHAWTPRAARWATALDRDDCPLIIEVDRTRPATAQTCWPASGMLTRAPWYVCPDDAIAAALHRCGVVPAKCRTIGPGAPGRRVDRTTARAALGLKADEVAVLPLPPYTRSGGTFMGVWSALLVEKIRPDLRLLVPPGPGELARTRRLVTTAGDGHILRAGSPTHKLETLIAAADLAILTATGPVALDGLALAMRLGVPIVASTTPQLRNLLDGPKPAAWLCATGDQEDGARQMLRAIEDMPRSQAQVQRARERGEAQFSEEQMIAAYADLYGHVVAHRATRTGAD